MNQEIKQNILKLPSLYVNKHLINIVGVNAAILAADILSKQSYFDKEVGLENGFFFNTADNIEKDTGLSYKQQKKAINDLVALGVLSIKKYGIPARLYFKINPNKYLDICADNTSITTTTSTNEVEIILPNKSKDEEMKDAFLTLFNTLKGEITGKRGEFKALSNTDMNNLKTLVKSGYNIQEFKKAIIAMLNAEWPKKTGNQTVSHILRVSNFNRYLISENKPIENKTSYGEY